MGFVFTNAFIDAALGTDKFPLLLAQHEHRTRRVAHDALGRAAQHRVVQSSLTVRGDDGWFCFHFFTFLVRCVCCSL